MGWDKAFHSNPDDQSNHSYRMNFRMPLLEICGRRRVLVENHLGISGYDEDRIIVKVCLGYIYVQGRALKITKICKEKLVITGVVDEIHFQGRQ